MHNDLRVEPIIVENWHLWERKLKWHVGVISERSNRSWSLDAILADMRTSKQFQRWVVVDENGEIYAFAITSVKNDCTKTFTMHGCVGKKRELWMKLLLDSLCVWAHGELGSTRFTMLARKGWKKDLQSMGFHPSHILFEFSLGE